MVFSRGARSPRQALSRPSGVVNFAEGNTHASGSEDGLCWRHWVMRFWVGGQGDGSFRALALGPVQLSAIDPMDDLDVIVGDMLPLQTRISPGRIPRTE